MDEINEYDDDDKSEEINEEIMNLSKLSEMIDHRPLKLYKIIIVLIEDDRQIRAINYYL